MTSLKVETHHLEVCRARTCFHVHVQPVGVRVEGPAQLHFYPERLPSADDQLIPMIQVGVVLCSVPTRLRAQQVHRTHR